MVCPSHITILYMSTLMNERKSSNPLIWVSSSNTCTLTCTMLAPTLLRTLDTSHVLYRTGTMLCVHENDEDSRLAGSLYALVDQGEMYPLLRSSRSPPSAHLFLYPVKTLLISRETTVPLPPTHPSSMSLSPADFSHVFVTQTLSCRFQVPTWFSHWYK
jgi:hypothetical protein